MVPAPFVFGKVPTRGDFVRAGPIGPLVDDLDAWLQRAILALRGATAEHRPAVSFVFGRPHGTIAGAFVASSDSAGRSFPLVAGGSLDGAPALTGADVTSLGPFLTAAARAAAAVVAGTPPDEALAMLTAPPGIAGPTPEVDRATLDGALGAFRQLQAPRYGLSLPLPASASAHAAAAGHWLDRIAAAGPRRAAMSVLWAEAPPGPRAVVFAAAPTADTLLYLLTGKPVDGVYEVPVPPPLAKEPD